MSLEDQIPSGFKPSPLGPIPNEWQVITLGTLVEIISGTSPSLYSLKSFGKYPYLKVEDLNNCEKYQTRSREYSDNEMNIVPKNSIIFPKRGAAILNNKVRINTIPVQMDSNLMAIYPRSSTLNNEYLYYRIITEQLHKIADTSTIPQINNKHIIPYKFPLPPLFEQTAIANCLSVWDNAIQRTQALIRQKELSKKWLMQQLLSGKKRLPGFDGEWKKTSAGEIFKSVSVKVNKNEELLSATQDKGIIPRSMLEARVTMPSGDLSAFKLVENGDFVISLRSFQGGLEYSEYRGIVSPAYTVLKPKQKICNEFFKQYFKSYDFIGHLAIAVIGIRDGKQVSYEDFCFVKIPFPTAEEQSAIARVLQAADKEIIMLKTKLEKLREQKKGLMQVLLTGINRLKVK